MLSIVRHPACALVLICFILGGCASKYTPQTTVVSHYPQCYSPIEALRQAEANFQSTLVTTTVIGTLLGATIGFISTGDAKGALIGAAAGAASGAAIGYAKAKSSEFKETNTRMASYLQDLDGDINGLNEVTVAARLAIQCYNREFQVALNEFKSKNITRAQFDTRYYEILSGTQEAERVMGVAITSTETREEQYQAALLYEKEQPISGRSTATAAKKVEPKKAVVEKPKPKPKKAVVEKPTPEPKKADVEKPKPKPKKAIVEEPAPVVVAEKELPKPANVEPTVEGLEEQTAVYQDSRLELIRTKETAVAMQASWAADLAALES